MPGAPTDPWFVHLVARLLEGDPATRALLEYLGREGWR
jgi:hypothetical protein